MVLNQPILSRIIDRLQNINSVIFVGFVSYLISSCAMADFGIANARNAAPSPTPAMITPSANSTLSDRNVTFKWARNGATVLDWYLRIGNLPGTAEYAEVRLTNPLTNSYEVRNLPLDGRNIHVEFSYRMLSGDWSRVHYMYTAGKSSSSAQQTPSAVQQTPTTNSTKEAVTVTAVAPSATQVSSSRAADNIYGTQAQSGVCPSSSARYSKSTLVDSYREFNAAYQSARPGDAIIIKNGTYNWGSYVAPSSRFSRGAERPYELNRDGTAAAPIYILAESVNGVHFNDSRVDWVFNGQHNVMAGFRFTNPGKIYVVSKDNRIACNYFSATRGNAYVIVENHDADRVEMDHNVFDGAAASAIVLWRCNPVVPNCTKNSKGAHIHHNTFKNKPFANANGHEAIVLGLGYSPTDEARTYNIDGEKLEAIIENNLFDGWNGEHELITIKSSKNILRNNCVINSPRATFVVRGGNDNLITGNWLENANGGLIISGRRNTIVYNYKARKFGDYFGFRLRTGEQYLQSFNPGLNFENLYAYIDAKANILRYNVFSGIQYLVNTTDQIGHIFRDFPTRNVISDNVIYTERFLGSNEKGGYYNNDGRIPESQYRSQNNWGNNTIILGRNLPASSCGNPHLFSGPGPSRFTAASNLLGGASTINAPSWWK